MFAGFGTADDTNWRFKEIIRAGGDGLSTAFDMPTLLGLDSDDPMALGRGRPLRRGHRLPAPTWRTSTPASTSATITTSMTINSPAAVIFAMFVAQAEQAGVDRARLGGTLQNDILKEYQAQKEFVFPPRPSMRLVRDTIALHRGRDAPLALGLDLRLPHPRGGLDGRRGAGVHARQRLRLRRAGDAGRACPSTRSRRGCRSSSTPTSTSSRRSPSTAPPGASGPAGCGSATAPSSERSLQLRFHTQTAGVSLTAQQPEVNIVRTAIEALAGVLGGTQSLHTNSMDEAMALPTEKAARIALRTQQVIAYETNVAHVADPLGGSWFVEALTDEMERQAEELFAHLDELGDGSMLEGVHPRASRRTGSRASIADSAYELERDVQRGPADRRRRQPLHRGQRRRPDRAPPDHQRGRGPPAASGSTRSATTATRPPSTRRSPACAPTPPTPSVNLMPALIDAVETLRHPRRDHGHAGRRLRPAHRDAHHLTPPRPARRPVRWRASPTVGMGTVDPCPPPARSRPDRGK